MRSQQIATVYIANIRVGMPDKDGYGHEPESGVTQIKRYADKQIILIS